MRMSFFVEKDGKIEQLRKLLERRGELTVGEIARALQLKSDCYSRKLIEKATGQLPLYETDGRPARFGLMK